MEFNQEEKKTRGVETEGGGVLIKGKIITMEVNRGAVKNFSIESEGKIKFLIEVDEGTSILEEEEEEEKEKKEGEEGEGEEGCLEEEVYLSKLHGDFKDGRIINISVYGNIDMEKEGNYFKAKKIIIESTKTPQA